MNVLRRCPQLRRSYATKGPENITELAKVARTASTPLAVRLRRRRQFGAVPEGSTDATPSGLTPSELARYRRLKATGNIQKDTTTGKPQSQHEWLAHVNARRSRIRGFGRKVRKGTVETEVLGRKVYLPNIVLRLVRNHTPPGQPYNPYEATFRIPQSVTKTDIRSLLLAMYGVQTTYIRTDNYISPWYRTMKGYERRSYKTYKRAVVGLVDPFYYPLRLEDMPKEEREERETMLEKSFKVHATRILQKTELLRRTMGGGKASFKFNAPYATKRSHILRIVNERRQEREKLVGEFTKEIQSLRKEKEKVDYKKVKERIDKSKKGTPPLDDSPSSPATTDTAT